MRDVHLVVVRCLSASLACSALVACDPGNKDPSDNSSNDGDKDDGNGLAGRDFVSQEVRSDGQPHELVANTALRLSFRDDENNLGASAGCNSFGGGYDTAAGLLNISQGGTTEIGCEPALAEQEVWYFDFLMNAPAITLSGDELMLEGGNVYVRYLDDEAANPDLGLFGHSWVVDTIIEGDAASNAAWPEPATFEFAADGSVAVFSGCNSGDGTVEVDGAKLRFVDVDLTKGPCLDALSQSLEDAVVRLVFASGWADWEVDAARLSVQNGAFGLGMTTE